MPTRSQRHLRELRAPDSSGLFDVDRTTAAYLAAMSVQPSAIRRNDIARLVFELNQAGLLVRLDALYLLAAHDQQAARVNLVAPGAFLASLVNAPAFVADRGYTGNGTTSHLNSGFIPSSAPSPRFNQNSSHLMLWSRTAAQGAAFDMGNNNAYINARNTSDQASHAINAATPATPANTDGSGSFISSRVGSLAANNVLYRNGALVAASATAVSAAVDTNAIFIGARSGTASFSTRQIAAASIGAGLTAPEAAALHAAIRNYLVRIGAA